MALRRGRRRRVGSWTNDGELLEKNLQHPMGGTMLQCGIDYYDDIFLLQSAVTAASLFLFLVSIMDDDAR